MRLTTSNAGCRRNGLFATILGSAILLLGGCGSSDPGYYTLSSWPGTAQAGGPLTLEVRTPTVASYLDRDYIVRNTDGYRIKLSKDAAWGEPLASMIGNRLALDLQQRLPGTNVFTQAGAISTEPQAVVELDVSQFAQDTGGNAEINATLSVQRPGSGPSASHVLHLTAAPDGQTIGALAASLSQLLGQVADSAARDARLIGPLPAPVPIDLSGNPQTDLPGTSP